MYMTNSLRKRPCVNGLKDFLLLNLISLFTQKPREAKSAFVLFALSHVLARSFIFADNDIEDKQGLGKISTRQYRG